ncbi:MAG TPA: EF-hand domain-containing protein [Sphingomicrobium sp.]|jgi:Ca2+-binding EF-hand superfamily protein
MTILPIRFAVAAVIAAVAVSPLAAQSAAGTQAAPAVPTRTQLVTMLDAGFKSLDTNNDGTLSQSEVAAAETKIIQTRVAQIRTRLEAEFTAADTNKDGQLSKAEFMAAAPQAPATGPNGAEALARYDSNKDGKISAAEFRAPRVAAFDAIDTNKDGTLSSAERRAGQKR